MMNRFWNRGTILILLVIGLLVGTTCPGRLGSGVPMAIALSNSPSPQLLDNLQHFLAQQNGTNSTGFSVEALEPHQWANACLEAAQPGELCAEVITPGYALTVETPEGLMRLHTDLQGRLIRPERQPGVDVPPSTPVPPAGE